MSCVDAPLEALVRAEMQRPRGRRLSRLRDLAATRGEARAAEAQRRADGAMIGLSAPLLAGPVLHDIAMLAGGAFGHHDVLAGALGSAGAR